MSIQNCMQIYLQIVYSMNMYKCVEVQDSFNIKIQCVVLHIKHQRGKKKNKQNFYICNFFTLGKG